MAGPSGLDPYTSAVSDVYQDLFAEGSFVGKGIFDVDAFNAVLTGRAPENTLLSHDLFEGIFARAALATDIEVLDEQPASYSVAVGRQHRWIRGDWQLLPWLFTARRALFALDRWKILDNLRRSLVGPALITLCVVSWLSGPQLAKRATTILVAIFALPVLARLALSLSRRATSSTFTGSVGGDLRANSRQASLAVVFLLDSALNAGDAIVRTLYRLTVSRSLLLEWKTMGQAERQLGRTGEVVEPRLSVGPWLCVGIFGLVLAIEPRSTVFAAPLLVLWSLAPPLARWLSRPLPPRDRSRGLTAADRTFLRLNARRTWRFFDTFVTEADQHLPPDNFQEEPRGVLAHRTSPTNIGLYLLSIVSARDFGFITLSEVVARLTATLSSVEKLERHEGHVLNWYDTTSLRPLEPQYVSTVDSGNLAAYLWTLREACAEACQRPLLGEELFLAAEDALTLASRASDVEGRSALETLSESVSAAAARFRREPATCRETLASLVVAADAAREGRPDTRYWTARAADGFAAALAEQARLAPHLGSLEGAPRSLECAALSTSWAKLSESLRCARSASEIEALVLSTAPLWTQIEAELGVAPGLAADDREVLRSFLKALRRDVARASEACAALVEALTSLGSRAGALADAMRFGFLFDTDRELFVIGYNVNTARLDASHYDLLASEARLGSLVAIAKGDAPQKHWFRLARPLTSGPGGRALLSWSGSMFEFLMPLLVTKNCPETLLNETYESVLRRQRAYGAARSVPWGVSESAYNIMDLGMTYQYRAFGVPGLGLKSGLGEDLVIAPYSTALAALVRPDVAIENLRKLTDSGAEGPYGYYESVDYTRRRLPPGRDNVVVKTFMAHHLGMTLLAFGEVLHGAPMQRRFHRDPRIKATELLLEERVPPRVASVTVRTASLPTTAPAETDFDVQEHMGFDSVPLARVHLLGQGELTTMVTSLGEGFTTWKGNDVTRFREDHALGAGGTFLYIRDLSESKLWSAGYQPTRATPDDYDAGFAIDRVEIRRRDGDIETFTEIVVSPELPVEVRGLTLTNHSAVERTLDVTSYMELVLAPRASDVTHRAFSSLFIQTEALPELGAVLAWRRPKTASESEQWIVQALDVEGMGGEGLELETSRPKFLGRTRTTARPAALDPGVRLTGTIGTVLDPALALRRRVTIPPGGRVTLHLLTGLASSRAQALELLDRCRTPNAVPRTFELAWSDARVELRHLRVSAAQSHAFLRLLSLLYFPQAQLRESCPCTPLRGRGMGALWTHGISGDAPIVIVRVDAPDFAELLGEVLSAQELWRAHGVESDVVVINEEPTGYALPLRDAIATAVRASPAEGRVNQRGGVFVRDLQELGTEDRALLLCAARVVLAAGGGGRGRARPPPRGRRRGAPARPRAGAPPRPAAGERQGRGRAPP
ncbi:MAG: glucoamylase family protein, partial [Polyangiales bacterium]